MKKDTIWYKGMLAKYKTEEAIAEVMRSNADKSRRNHDGPYFMRDLRDKDPNKFKEISGKGGKNRNRDAL